ncbi:MAG: HAD-IA family hydrolase, partial [Clostridiales bacterium]|nr:HAD-IA family hydrolase [Clostridiales bacterium]
KPNIRLSESVVSVLNLLKSSECIIGLITDGRSVQQRNKMEALGLNRWIMDEDIVISEEFGSEKPTSANYEYFMKRYPECDEFIYIGDNLKKDFIAPNALRWLTVCLKDDGRNIHKQDFTSVSTKAMPKIIIDDIMNLPFLYE